MLKRIVRLTIHQFAPPDSVAHLANGSDALTRQFGRWVREKCVLMVPDGPAERLQRHLLDMSLRPGERDVYAREYPASTNLSDVQFVLGKYRKNEFIYLSELKQRTFAQIIEKELPEQLDPRPAVPESTQLVLCLYELIELHVNAAYYSRFNMSRYVMFEDQIAQRDTDFVYVREPMIVQLFNHWQVYVRVSHKLRRSPATLGRIS